MVLIDKQLQVKLGDMFDLKKSSGVTMDSLLKQINPNSIDLTIDRKYKRPNRINNDVVYGFTCEEERELYAKAYWADCEAENGYILMKPGDVILAVTREYVTMPPNISGQLFTKSTLGRMFINHMMAGLVDAGFEGRLTLELKNEGVHTIRIPVGARVVQMICFGLYDAPDRLYGDATRRSRYQNARTLECAKWDGVNR
jgi:dCTP deaminase